MNPVGKRTVLLNGSPLKDGDVVTFRNGQHTSGTSPHFDAWQQGKVAITLNRAKPFRRHPAGIDSIGIAGAVPEVVSFDDWMDGLFNVEQYLVEVRGLSVATAFD